jgi:hypothetical protein
MDNLESLSKKIDEIYYQIMTTDTSDEEHDCAFIIGYFPPAKGEYLEHVPKCFLYKFSKSDKVVVSIGQPNVASQNRRKLIKTEFEDLCSRYLMDCYEKCIDKDNFEKLEAELKELKQLIDQCLHTFEKHSGNKKLENLHCTIKDLTEIALVKKDTSALKIFIKILHNTNTDLEREAA